MSRDALSTAPAPVQAGPVRTLSIMVRSIGVTLAITVPTLWDSWRGRFSRAVNDGRLIWWSERLVSYVGLRLRVVNPGAVAIPPGRPCILMCNHSSLYDIPLTLLSFRESSIRMLTKKELFRVPVWGRGLRTGEFLSIDRADREQAIRDLDVACEKMADGIVVWIAPEGTRSRTGALGPFKKGAFMLALQTGATIIPLGIRGASRVLPAKTTRFRLGVEAEVHVGRPIETSGRAVADRDALMHEVRAEIRRLMGSD